MWLLMAFVAVANGNVLKSFLSNGRAAVKSSGHSLILCLGNEAADADSIVSSLCHSFLRQSTVVVEATQVLPLVSVPRNILALRPETEILLKMVSLELDDLICVEEIDLAMLSRESRIKGLILTDHNSLSKCVSTMLESTHEMLVQEIIDHHIDKHEYMHVQGASRNIAFDANTGRGTVGSACTLVAETMISMENALDAETRLLLSTLLAGVILIDTQNMRPTGPGTNRDAEILEKLMNSQMFLHGCFVREQLSDTLCSAKMAPEFWASLSAHQALIIDYKQFQANKGCEFGMSTIACSVEFLMKKTQIRNEMARMMMNTRSNSSSGLILLAIMASYECTKQGYIRELLLASFDPKLLHDIIALPAISSLQLKPLPQEVKEDDFDCPPVHVMAFRQGNIEASRKLVAPLLEESINTLFAH